MKANFKQMFENYLPPEVIDVFSNSEITKLFLDEKNNLVRAHIVLPFVPEIEQVTLAEKMLSEALNKRVRFTPFFENVEFSPKYFDYVIDEVKFRGKNPNGFFSDLKIDVKDKTLTLVLSHGGKDILEKNLVNSEISSIIEFWFSQRFTVVFEEDGEAPIYQNKEYVEPIVYRTLPTPAPEPLPKPKYTGTYLLPYIDDNPELILGKTRIKNVTVPIANLDYNTKFACVWGDIFFVSSKDIKNGESTVYNFYISDGTDSANLKCFVKNDGQSKVPSLKEGDTVMVEGSYEFDDYSSEYIIKPKKIQKVERTQKTDDAKEKRVELHLHTNLSDQDGVSSPESLIKQAHDWGHKAIAITDHGVVQAYPEAMNTVERIWEKDPDF